MSDKYLTSFVDELPRMDDDSLLRTLVRFNAAPGEYRPEAISVARAEMERRGLAAAQLSEAVGHVVREAVESVFDDAVRLAEDGRTIAQIQTHLKARGLNDLSAAEMARRAWEMPTEQRNRAGQRNMISGAALCFVGLLPTAATYFVAASSAGGGRYALFWGMVLGGLLQFLRGVRQVNR